MTGRTLVFGWLVCIIATDASAGSLTLTDAVHWSKSSLSDNLVPATDTLEIDVVSNEVDGWYRRSWNGADDEAQAQKDDGTVFSSPDRCLRASNNTSFTASTLSLGDYEMRTGPWTEDLSATSYLSTATPGVLLGSPVELSPSGVRFVIGGSRIAQRNLQVELLFSDLTTSTVTVPIPVDTTTGAARDGSGPYYTRTGVLGLTRTTNPSWDRDSNGISDCSGNGADIVRVSNPTGKLITGVSFRYPSYDDATANTGWLSGPLAVSLLDVDIDAVYSYRGLWRSQTAVADAISIGPNAIFHQISWSADIASGSEILIGLSCADDTDGDGLLDPSEIEPEELVSLSEQISPYDLTAPCSGRYVVLNTALIDAFDDAPVLYDLTLTYDIDSDDDGYGLLGIVTAPDCNDGNASAHPGAAELAGNNSDDNCDGSESCYSDIDNDGARGITVISSSDADCNDAGESLAADALDCADNDAGRTPGKSESIGDGIDQDCNLRDLCYRDVDRDTYGSALVSASVTAVCLTANNEAVRSGDCDDNNNDRYPTHTEVPGDGIDQDCNTHDRCYSDTDGDGYGTSSQTSDAAGIVCVGEGESVLGTDCDDGDAARNPGAIEITGDNLDENCDDRVSCYVDLDDDGARTAATATGALGDTDCDDASEGQLGDPIDCDDTNAAITPNAAETPGDNVDSDCNGSEDCWIDQDDDGARSDAVSTGGDADCDDPSEATSADALDCDDLSSARYPGAPEIPADGIDTDCDGVELCYTDSDGDGARTETTAPSSDLDCDDPSEATLTAALDCDDTDASIYPGASDPCNAIDDDCDGMIDDGAGVAVPWYEDTDGDAYGDVLTETLAACSPGITWVSDGTDCDDTDPLVYPDSDERCNGADDDCDGQIDDVLPVSTWYPDSDGDGYGDPLLATDEGCPPDPSWISSPGDCDDTDPLVHPTAPEICNGIDDDCAEGIDLLGSPLTWYRDADNDGIGDIDETLAADCAPGDGWVEQPGDCDDTDPKRTDICLSGSGCGCDSSPSPRTSALLLLTVLLGVRARRTSQPQGAQRLLER